MRIFITGASGFVGGAAAYALKEQHSIIAMSRSARSDEAIRALGIEPVRCQLGDVPVEMLHGVDVVIHAAAFVGEWGTRDEFWKANVEGTAQLLQAARHAGVRRFIHIGTEAALFFGQDMVDIDETYPYPEHTPFLYSETKAEAERRVLAANDPDAGFETISIRPRMVWGPGDQTLLPVVKRMVESGKFAWADGGRARTETTHIANLVHAIELAFTRGRGGEAYFVTDGEQAVMKGFFRSLLATENVDIPDKSVPGWLIRGVAFGAESVWRMFGLKSQPPVTRLAACMMTADCTINIDKAREELGYEPQVSVRDGLAALAAD